MPVRHFVPSIQKFEKLYGIPANSHNAQGIGMVFVAVLCFGIKTEVCVISMDSRYSPSSSHNAATVSESATNNCLLLYQTDTGSEF